MVFPVLYQQRTVDDDSRWQNVIAIDFICWCKFKFREFRHRINGSVTYFRVPLDGEEVVAHAIHEKCVTPCTTDNKSGSDCELGS